VDTHLVAASAEAKGMSDAQQLGPKRKAPCTQHLPPDRRPSRALRANSEQAPNLEPEPFCQKKLTSLDPTPAKKSPAGLCAYGRFP